MSTGQDFARWLGALLLGLPAVLFLFPKLVFLTRERFVTIRDRLQLSSSRSTSGGLLLVFLLVFPAALLFFSLHDLSVGNYMAHWLPLLGYGLVMAGLALARPPGRPPLDVTDAMLMVVLVLPFLFAKYYDELLEDKELRLDSTWPRVSAIRVTTLNLGLAVFLVFRPLRDIGYSLRVRDYSQRALVGYTLAGLVMGVGLLIPLCFAAGACHSPDAPSFGRGLGLFFTTLLLYSIPQETLFRGVLQNLLHARFDFNAESERYHMTYEEELLERIEEEPVVKGYRSKTSVRKVEDDPHASGWNPIFASGAYVPPSNMAQGGPPLLTPSEADSAEFEPAPLEEVRMGSFADDLEIEEDDPESNAHKPAGTLDLPHWTELEQRYRWKKWRRVHREFFRSHGVLGLIAFPHWRDVLAWFVATGVYAAVMLDFDSFSTNLLLGTLLLGALTGWVWRHTSCALSAAVVNAVTVFLAVDVFQFDR